MPSPVPASPQSVVVCSSASLGTSPSIRKPRHAAVNWVSSLRQGLGVCRQGQPHSCGLQGQHWVQIHGRRWRQQTICWSRPGNHEGLAPKGPPAQWSAWRRFVAFTKLFGAPATQHSVSLLCGACTGCERGLRMASRSDKWVCNVCTAENAPTATECDLCTEPRPAARSSSRRGNSVPLTPHTQAEAWECPLCATPNRLSDSVCSRCTVARLDFNPPAATGAVGGAAGAGSGGGAANGSSAAGNGAAANPAQWVCPSCTFANELASARCSLCMDDRPAHVHAPTVSLTTVAPAAGGRRSRTGSGHEAAAAPQPGPKPATQEWACELCTLSNPPTLQQCAVCGAARSNRTALPRSVPRLGRQLSADQREELAAQYASLASAGVDATDERCQRLMASLVSLIRSPDASALLASVLGGLITQARSPESVTILAAHGVVDAVLDLEQGSPSHFALTRVLLFVEAVASHNAAVLVSASGFRALASLALSAPNAAAAVRALTSLVACLSAGTTQPQMWTLLQTSPLLPSICTLLKNNLVAAGDTDWDRVQLCLQVLRPCSPGEWCAASTVRYCGRVVPHSATLHSTRDRKRYCP